MNEAEALRLSVDLLERAETAIVTSIDSAGFPQTRAMFNLRRKEQFPELAGLCKGHSNIFTAYFTTNTSSGKISQFRKNPKVSVYYCKPGEFRGLMLSGEMEIVTAAAEKEKVWQKGWVMYYPGGVHDQDHTVLLLRPETAKYYHALSVHTFSLEGKQ